MTDATRCPLCGQPLPTDGPAGVCPACVLRLGLETNAAGAARGKAPEPAELAAFFPQLEILELVGQGGMGMVYKARQRSLDRLVALKILSLDASADPAFEERFARESRTLAQLTHPNIVTVFDSGTADRFYYLVMEYVDGVNLREAIHNRALAPADALQIIRQICDALQYAHDEGVVHRDIKPENILLDSRGRVRIADFGVAKLLGRTPIDISLTATHQILGTFRYMAPEQIERPLSVDHRADIYSLGVVLYELLTGELPLGRFALPSERGTDAGLDKVVLRALERDPERRYQRASELKTDVTSVPSEETASPRAVPVVVMPFTATDVETGEDVAGQVELHADRVSFDFEMVLESGRRTFRSVQVPLNRVRSVEYVRSWWEKGILMQVDRGPWTVKLPFVEGAKVLVQAGSNEEGEAFATAMNERATKLKTDVMSTRSKETAPTRAQPVMVVRFTATDVQTLDDIGGRLELYDDRVTFDFGVVSWGRQRTFPAVHIPLNRVRSVDRVVWWWRTIAMRIEPGPWTAGLPFSEGETIWIGVGSQEEGERLVAAMRERLGSPVEGADMLKTIPNTFSWTFSIMDGPERVAHAVDLSWGRDKGELTVHGVRYIARREGIMSGAWVLESAAGVVARATKPSALRRSLLVEHAGRQYTLRAISALRREFELLDGSMRVGSITPEGVFSRRAAADLPSTLPLALRVFIIWLTVMQWKVGEGS